MISLRHFFEGKPARGIRDRSKSRSGDGSLITCTCSATYTYVTIKTVITSMLKL